MALSGKHILWTVWAAGTLGAAAFGFKTLFVSGDQTMLLPGETTGVHHQFEIACATCHTSDAFADVGKVRKDINKTCVTCHKDELKASDDSHPKKKFTNPRMASYWEQVDARYCTTCHIEHVPEDTLAGMLTLPGDYCVACHSEGEQDVRVERPSHAGLTFDTCASAGCHNYHDNRALYEAFLVKHGNEPWLLPQAVLPAAATARARARATDPAAIEAYIASVAAPDDAQKDPTIAHDWAASAHAAADVDCAGCHAPKAETAAEVTANWIEAPDEAVCESCHRAEAKTFALGRHGMRDHPEIAKPRKAKSVLKSLGMKKPPEGLISALETYLADPDVPPQMSTAEARVPLLPDAHGQNLTCNTYHKPHEQDLEFAAVEACLTCHADDHSQAFKDSPHYQLYTAELAGDLPPGSGVTCATCHMPKTEKGGKVVSNHNQNDTLRPNEKMIRPVCMSCHGLGFAIDALADPGLIARNFSGQPDRHIESIDWALKRVEPPETDANQ